MKICQKCGYEVKNDTNICPNCNYNPKAEDISLYAETVAPIVLHTKKYFPFFIILIGLFIYYIFSKNPVIIEEFQGAVEEEGYSVLDVTMEYEKYNPLKVYKAYNEKGCTITFADFKNRSDAGRFYLDTAKDIKNTKKNSIMHFLIGYDKISSTKEGMHNAASAIMHTVLFSNNNENCKPEIKKLITKLNY